ncbi:MAG: cation:proton antiporter [Acidobacteriota bacterium]
MRPLMLADPALSIAIALAAGVLAQSLARHLRIPGIVLLLGAGLLLGPDLIGIVRPGSLGIGLQTLVGFAVAVILFEGGMNLNLRRLRHEARSIRQLVTLGALVTAVGGSLCARLILGWGWTASILFGTLVIVTGPTVINPLLRRLRINRNLATVLEAEGVLVDAIGAILAVVALEVAISPSRGALAFAAWDLVSRLGFGLALGLAGGLLIALLLRPERVVPEGLENVFTLSLALAFFQVSNAVLPETGIVTVAVAGMVVGNVRTRALDDLREFKEQLTVLLIGMLFVLLAADVRIEEVVSLGWPGVTTVLALMFVVRPLNILIGTLGSDLKLREKAFLSWIAPRGIVAAAVASLFAQALSREGIPLGNELRAMVFLVIAVTVPAQGLTGGLLARALGLRRPSDSGYVVLGANELGRALGRVLRGSGQEVVLLESNPDSLRAAEEEGFRVLFGTGLSESLLQRAELDGRAGCLAVTPNDGVNLLFARRAREQFRVPRAWVALRHGHLSVTKKMVLEAGAAILFGEPRNLELWTLWLERRQAAVECWRLAGKDAPDTQTRQMHEELASTMLPLAVRRGGKVLPMDHETTFRADDELVALVLQERRPEVAEWLRLRRWRPAPEEPAPETAAVRSAPPSPGPAGA